MSFVVNQYKVDELHTTNSTKFNFNSSYVSGIAFAAIFPLVTGNTISDTQISNDYNSIQIETRIDGLPLNIQSIQSRLSLLIEHKSFDDLFRLKEKIHSYLINNKIESQYVDRLYKSVNDALRFLDIFPRDLLLPTAFCAEDGEIILEWFFSDKSIIVSIVGDGYYGYALLKDDKYIPGQSDGDISKVIPTEFYEYLKS